jgi:hypothetical protein
MDICGSFVSMCRYMGLCLLYDGLIGLVQLCHSGLGCGGICGLQGLLEASAQDLLQMFGIGPAIDPGVMPTIGILYLCGHDDVSYWGNCPGL